MAAVDMFLKIEGIQGESKNSAHKGQIEVLSFSWGLSRNGGTHRGSRPASFSFTHTVDKSSPKLLEAQCAGKVLPSPVYLIGAKALEKKTQDFYKVTLSDCLISGIQSTGDESAPQEEVTFIFAKIAFEYKPQGEAAVTGECGGLG